MTEGAGLLPFHVARKKVPYLDEQGQSGAAAEGERPEIRAFHLRRAAAGRALAGGGDHAREEFAPLKNATGADSPETVQAALSNLAADWLTHAGVEVPRTARRRARCAAGDQPAVRAGRRGVRRAGGSEYTNRGTKVFFVTSWRAARRQPAGTDNTGGLTPRRSPLSKGRRNASRDDHGRRRRHAVLAAQPAAAAQAVPRPGRRPHAVAAGAGPHRGAAAGRAHLGHHRASLP